MSVSEVFARLRSAISGKEKDDNITVAPVGDDKEVSLPAAIDSDYKDRCVLVGVVKSPRQFDLLVREKFYHIPMSQVNECQFPVKYVAIYQSKRFFGKKAGIKLLGEVESYSTVKRCDIRELPKNSNEKYLYFKIKRWRRLENNITANEMETTAFSTTLYLIKSARDSAELSIRTREEHLFYRKLVNEVKRLVKTHTPDGQDIVYNDYTVKLKGGMLYLYFVDVLEYAVGYDIFLEKPTNVIKDIFDYYPEL